MYKTKKKLKIFPFLAILLMVLPVLMFASINSYSAKAEEPTSRSQYTLKNVKIGDDLNDQKIKVMKNQVDVTLIFRALENGSGRLIIDVDGQQDIVIGQIVTGTWRGGEPFTNFYLDFEEDDEGYIIDLSVEKFEKMKNDDPYIATSNPGDFDYSNPFVLVGVDLPTGEEIITTGQDIEGVYLLEEETEPDTPDVPVDPDTPDVPEEPTDEPASGTNDFNDWWNKATSDFADWINSGTGAGVTGGIVGLGLVVLVIYLVFKRKR